MTGPHFRDYHLLLDPPLEEAAKYYASSKTIKLIGFIG